jgi:hypothetical protein
MLTGIRGRIPRPLKRAVRKRVLDPLARRICDQRLPRVVREYRSNVAPDREFIRRLRHAWGNEAWSADASYVCEVISRAGGCSGPVLECGSGLTTLVAALAGEKRDVTVWSLEQDEGFADLVSRRLRRNKINNVHIRYAPLKDYGEFVWYDLTGIDLPDHFELVVCDGPGVRDCWGDSYLMWRYGVLPVLEERGVSVGEMLLDDATEPRGANLLSRWEKDFGMVHRLIRAEDGDCAVLNRAT